MAFTILNLPDAYNTNQSEIDKVDFDIIVAGFANTGVMSGCAVTAQGSPDMTVAVAAGVISVGGVQATVTSGNVTVGTAHATLPRFDLITVNNAGTKACTAGTAAAEPVFPAIPANSVVLASIYVEAADTTIESNKISDRRIILGEVAPLVIASKTAAYTATVDDDVILADATSAAFTVTLYTAVGHSGETLVVKRQNEGANTVTVDGNGSETIDGETTFVLTLPKQSITVCSDGSNWVIL